MFPSSSSDLRSLCLSQREFLSVLFFPGIPYTGMSNWFFQFQLRITTAATIWKKCIRQIDFYQQHILQLCLWLTLETLFLYFIPYYLSHSPAKKSLYPEKKSCWQFQIQMVYTSKLTSGSSQTTFFSIPLAGTAFLTISHTLSIPWKCYDLACVPSVLRCAFAQTLCLRKTFPGRCSLQSWDLVSSGLQGTSPS